MYNLHRCLPTTDSADELLWGETPPRFPQRVPDLVVCRCKLSRGLQLDLVCRRVRERIRVDLAHGVRARGCVCERKG